MKNLPIRSLLLAVLLLGVGVSHSYVPAQNPSTAQILVLISDTAADVRDSSQAWTSDSLQAHLLSGVYVDSLGTGCTVTTTDSVYYSYIPGIMACITPAAKTCTSNSAALTLKALSPAGLWPARIQGVDVVGVTDSGLTSLAGSVSVGITGVGTYSTKTVSGTRVSSTATFTTSLLKGFAQHTACYSLK